VLVGEADEAPSEVVELSPAEAPEIDAEHVDPSGRRPVEAGEDPQHRRLAGAGRPEDDDDLALADVEREPLQRS
jgi:hypothetical protein